MGGMIDLLLDAEAIGLRVVCACERGWGDAVKSGPGIIWLGVHTQGPIPIDGLDDFDMLLTVQAGAPAPWVSLTDIEAGIAHLRDVIAQQPLAATVLAQVLRITPMLEFDFAILLESFAYSTLLASGGFRRWLGALPPQRTRSDNHPRVRMQRTGEGLEIIFDRPRGRNAIDAAMRDALVEALQFASFDPDRAPVVLRAEGAVFSIGGDLADFGRADDPAIAHAIRTLRSAASALHSIADRATTRLHGPCVGAGIEIPAAAARVVARPGTSFRLPEVTMGVIPGAGGTVTIPRRIGRQRSCWMAMSGETIDLETACRWGLVDAVDE